MIPYSRQYIDEDDISEVIKVLRSDLITQGDAVPKFELKIRELVSVKYSSAFNSATSALHASCVALEIKKGDYVWTSPISFVASANCALYCGANIDFVDINPNTYNISIESLAKKLQDASTSNKLPKVLIVVHLSGQSCEMDKIFMLSKQYGFKIIEDASHALGGIYKQENIGNCKYSDICIFSFHPVKMITTAEGGMAVTNNIKYDYKLKRFRSHGICTFSKNSDEQLNDFFKPMIDLGYNYRMSDLSAALGLSQLKKIKKFLKRRREIKNYYNDQLSHLNLPITTPYESNETCSSNHLYILRVHENNKLNRNELLRLFKNQHINLNVHYIPIYKHKYYEQFEHNDNDFPNAEKYGREALSLPNYYGLSDESIDAVIKNIKLSLG